MQNQPQAHQPNTVPLSLILSWPNTPDHATMEALRSLFQDQDKPARYADIAASAPEHLAPDIAIYIERLTVGQFRQEASQFYEQTKKTYPETSPLTILHATARTGTTDTTIGMAILTDDPTIPQAPSVPGTSVVMFTRLPRDPRWAGMDSHLPYIRHLQAIVFQDESQATPSVDAVVAIPRDIEIQGDTTTSFPTGSPSTLHDLLAWHGAHPRLWIVR